MSNKSEKTDLGRRDFLRKSALAVAAVPFAGLLMHQKRLAAAEDLPKAEEGMRLDYVHTSEVEGEYCHNCRWWKGNDAEWGKCEPFFTGLRVHRDGWCNQWAEA